MDIIEILQKIIGRFSDLKSKDLTYNKFYEKILEAVKLLHKIDTDAPDLKLRYSLLLLEFIHETSLYKTLEQTSLIHNCSILLDKYPGQNKAELELVFKKIQEQINHKHFKDDKPPLPPFPAALIGTNISQSEEDEEDEEEMSPSPRATSRATSSLPARAAIAGTTILGESPETQPIQEPEIDKEEQKENERQAEIEARREQGLSPEEQQIIISLEDIVKATKNIKHPGRKDKDSQ